MANNAKANVSEHSRESGRTPVHVLAQRLMDEKDALIKEKVQIESELSLLSADKCDDMARKAYRDGNCNASMAMQIKSDYTRKRHDLLKRKKGIEERVLHIKATLQEKNLIEKKMPTVMVLERIEDLLIRILVKLDA